MIQIYTYTHPEHEGEYVELLMTQRYVPPQAITLLDHDGNSVRFELQARP